jgi:Domain of unknown function (DUF4292)
LQKYALIILSIILTGCSLTKRSIQTESDKNIIDNEIISQIKDLNVTKNDFVIQKAEIEIKSEAGKEKIVGNMKFRKPGTYLLSIRGQAGIEAARILITADTILINDRINKKLYHGSPGYLLEKYGFKINMLPIIFGDFVADIYKNDTIKCVNNQAYVSSKDEDKEISYVINCARKKVYEIRLYDPVSGNMVRLKFEKFGKNTETNFARTIKIEDTSNNTTITISIEKIELGGESMINFIPGKNYEDIVLK